MTGLTVTAVRNMLRDRRVGHSSEFVDAPDRRYATPTREALLLLGRRIRLARKRRRLSEHGLAERVGVARSTVQRIERGDPTVGIGLVFEAATVAGVALFHPPGTSLRADVRRTDEVLALLPASVRGPDADGRTPVDDDF